jgi:hypothetical protein
MRAKLPNEEGYVERDGVRLFYEIYADGPETIVEAGVTPPPCDVSRARGPHRALPEAVSRHRWRRGDSHQEFMEFRMVQAPSRTRASGPVRVAHI